MNFYRVDIETRNERGARLHLYRFENELFSVANKKYQIALAKAKQSSAPKIVAHLDRFDNGVKNSVCFFYR